MRPQTLTAARASDKRPLRIVSLLQIAALAEPEKRMVQQVRHKDQRQHPVGDGAEDRHSAFCHPDRLRSFHDHDCVRDAECFDHRHDMLNQRLTVLLD